MNYNILERERWDQLNVILNKIKFKLSHGFYFRFLSATETEK